jgi:hypothetical protein
LVDGVEPFIADAGIRGRVEAGDPDKADDGFNGLSCEILHFVQDDTLGVQDDNPSFTILRDPSLRSG